MEIIDTIPGLSHEDYLKLISVFRNESDIAKVILYGSRAKGDYRPGSDIDLTIKGDAVSTSWLMDLSVKIDDLLLPYEVDLSILHHIENPDLIDHINRVGKVVFSNG